MSPYGAPGKPRYYLRKRPYEAAYNGFKSIVRLKGKHLVSITYEEYLEIIAPGKCFYCEETLKWPKHNARDKNYSQSYHLDRSDSTLGYVSGNVVACCKDCNFAKHLKTPEQFYAWISRLYYVLKKRNLCP